MNENSNNNETAAFGNTMLAADALADALKEVKAKKAETQNILSQLNQQECELKIEIFIRDTGLKVGTKVSFGEKSGIISRYSTKWGDVKPVIKYFKKDGTLGERESELYSWDMKKLQILS